jgi:MFS family permease
MIWVRRILAVVVGIVVAVVLVFVLEQISNILYPPAEGVDLTDPKQLEKHIAGLPLPAFLIVLAAYLIASFVGGYVAALIAGEKPALFASIVAGFILAATVLNLYFIPHPQWFAYVALLGIAIMGVLAGSLAPKRRAVAKDAKPKAEE